MVLTKKNMKLWLIGGLFLSDELCECFMKENVYANKIYMKMNMYEDDGMYTTIGTIKADDRDKDKFYEYKSGGHSYESATLCDKTVKIIVMLENER